MFLNTPSIRSYLTLPAHIFSDERLSIGAKGLYAQLVYSTEKITCLEDLTSLTSSTKEEIKTWWDELNSTGYIEVPKSGTDKRGTLKDKPQSQKTIDKKLDQEAVNEYAEKTIEKSLNAYEKLMKLIDEYKLGENVTQLLKVYFEKWLNKRGRFADADELHGYVVRAKIGELVSFHLSDDDMITCIQNSIDKEWFKFVNPNSAQASSGPSFKQFDKAVLRSGSYTEDDIKEIKARAEEEQAKTGKGIF